MNSLIGPIDDGFAIFATPVAPNQYSVVAWPPVAGVAEEFSVSTVKLMLFLAKRWGNAERFGPTWHPDVFVHSLTEDEIRALTQPVESVSRLQEHPRRAAA